MQYRDKRHPYGEVLAGSFITMSGLAKRLMLSSHVSKENPTSVGIDCLSSSRISSLDRLRGSARLGGEDVQADLTYCLFESFR